MLISSRKLRINNLFIPIKNKEEYAKRVKKQNSEASSFKDKPEGAL